MKGGKKFNISYINFSIRLHAIFFIFVNSFNSKYIYIGTSYLFSFLKNIYLFIYLAVLGLSCGVRASLVVAYGLLSSCGVRAQ